MEVRTTGAALRLKSISNHIAPHFLSANRSNDLNHREGGHDHTVVLIGSIINDIQATPHLGQSLQHGGSVPGNICQVPGGVSFNIARNLALLIGPSESGPLLISVVGDDQAGRTLLSCVQTFGLCSDGIAIIPGSSTPSVSIIFGSDGDVAASVADVALLETALTPQVVKQHIHALSTASIVVLDADLGQDTIEEACRMASLHKSIVWFEPVSAPKASRAVKVMSHLEYISPNAAELRSMADAVLKLSPRKHRNASHGVEDAEHSNINAITLLLLSLRPHLQAVLEAGVKNVVVTLGSSGAALCTLSKDSSHILIQHCPALPAKIINCSGAGDCLVAGMVHGLLTKRSNSGALAYGVAAAKQAVECSANVPLELNPAAIELNAKLAELQLQTLTLPCGCCCPACCAMVLSARTCGLIVTAIMLPPVAVMVSKDSIDSDFWLNLLLTLLAWLPGQLHAIWVVTRDADTMPYAEYHYAPLPPTMPPSSKPPDATFV